MEGIILGAYHVPPENLDGFPDAEWVAGKTGFNAGKVRRRWKDKDGKIYEWDYQHGRVERYSARGVHEGEFDPKSGDRLKDPIEGRKVEP